MADALTYNRFTKPSKSAGYSEVQLRPLMLKTLPHQVIALAGLFQALLLVQRIAKRGEADREEMETAVSSILKIDSDDVPDVYGGIRRLDSGLRQLERQLAGPGRMDAELARYMAVLIVLEDKLMKQPAMVESIGVAIHRAQEEAAESGLLDAGVLQSLAAAYQETLSRLVPRVLVSGEQRYLSDADNACKIRVLLLAGIRSAVLWRQCGGARWKLLFNRARLHWETRRLLDSLSENRA